jgi:uncharacterized damage-inducible protein DinB
MMNPYAKYLGDRDPIAVIGSTTAALESFVSTLSPKRISEAPAPGKWSVREILCHLADTELTFAFRLRQTLAESHHVIQPMDQEKWAKMYRAYDAADALRLFASARRWNLALIHAAPPDAFLKPVTHPERGELTFQILVETMAGHDLNHLGQF